MILKYRALDSRGNKITGEFVGNKQDLVDFLRQEGYLIIDIQELKPKFDSKYQLNQFLTDLENLNFLLESGTTLDEALSSLIKSFSSSSQINFWETLRNEVKQGKLFSDALMKAMSKGNSFFYPSFVNLIKAAESAGKIKVGILNYLTLVKKIQEVKSNIINSLAYPAFLLLSTLIVLDLIFLFILPKFSAIFSPSDLSKLSSLSKLEISLGFWISSHQKESLIIAISTIILLGLLPMLIFNKIINYISKITIARSMILSFDFVNFFNTLSLALQSDLTLLEALKLSTNVVTSREMKQSIDRIITKIKEGKTFSEAIQNLEIFPEEIKTVIKTSEKTSSLDKVFLILSKRYEKILSRKISIFTKFLEPIIIIVIGAIIGTIIFGIMNAILGLTEVL